MSGPSFSVKPRELVRFHRCFSSKICIRIFKVFRDDNVLNISAIARKAGCTNNDALRHLRSMVELGISRSSMRAATSSH